MAPAAAGARTKWDVHVLAHVPPPGYPALSRIAPDRTIYVGTFTNATGSANGPSHLYSYSPDGVMLRDWTIQGQSADGDNGIQVAAQDAQGDLYLLDRLPPRVLRFDPHTGTQSTCATFSDVHTATVMDNPPEPDYAAWGPGRQPLRDRLHAEPHLARAARRRQGEGLVHPQLDGTLFGPAGIVPDGSPGKLQKIWESGPAQGPDGFALARSGNVCMALVGPGTNQLVEISPTGEELGRTPATPLDNQAMSMPFDEASRVQFDDDRMIITNDAYFSGDETHWMIYDVYAGEPGAPVSVPGG